MSMHFARVKEIVGLQCPAGVGFVEASDASRETKTLRVRVSSSSKVFYMSARWRRGATSSTSRALGIFTETERDERNEDGDKVYLTLAEAREKVREWDRLRRAGIDPAEKRTAAREAKERAEREAESAAEEAKVGVFRNVVVAYLADPAFRSRKRADKAERREIRPELLDPKRNPWLDKHVTEIEDEDVVSLVAAIRDRPARWKGGKVRHQGCPAQAMNALGHIRRIFAWAASMERRKKYGLKFDPIAHVKNEDCKLKKKERQRVLSNDEILAYWRATGKMAYPWGPFFRLLLVTGQRLSEVLHASWPEIDRAEKLLTVPAERFKSNAEHRVPLSDLAMEIIETLPRFDGGPFLFSVKKGASAATGIGKAKKDLNALVLVELREIGRERGEAEADALRPFVNHDMRRVIKSQMSALRIPDEISEYVIGHGKKGLKRVYDQHRYLGEMREAMQRWADRLRMITNPPAGSNVVVMKRVS